MGSGGGENKMKTSGETSRDLREGKVGQVLHPLTHYQQRHHWDCGLSCILMILPYKDRTYVLDNLSSFLDEQGFGESTWTIDLCYILHRFNIGFRYTTTTMGVDPGYIKENFYDKVLAKDSGRVNSRFAEAPSLGMSVEEVAVTLSDILSHLDTSGPVIVLTNANLLTCTSCRSNLSSYISSSFTSSQYQGHYVVLVGYDSLKQEIIYRNPTLKDKVCSMPFSTLEEARTSYGTDEDVIFIQSSPPLPS